MNIFPNTLIIFIFIFSVIYLKYPIIKNDDPIMNKVYLFLGVLALEIILLSVTRVDKDCKSNNKNDKCKKVLQESIKIALLAVIGYSLYIDIILFPKYNIKIVQNEKLLPFYVSGMIAIFIFIAKNIDNILENF